MEEQKTGYYYFAENKRLTVISNVRRLNPDFSLDEIKKRAEEVILEEWNELHEAARDIWERKAAGQLQVIKQKTADDMKEPPLFSGKMAVELLKNDSSMDDMGINPNVGFSLGASATYFVEYLLEKMADKFGNTAFIDAARIQSVAAEDQFLEFLTKDPKVLESAIPDESEYEPDENMLNDPDMAPIDAPDESSEEEDVMDRLPPIPDTQEMGLTQPDANIQEEQTQPTKKRDLEQMEESAPTQPIIEEKKVEPPVKKRAVSKEAGLQCITNFFKK